MRRLALPFILAAALLSSAVALRQKQPEATSATDDGALISMEDKEAREPHRQSLHNFVDLQYYGDMSIGGQDLKVILDTGSFEVVVFGAVCEGCGIAGRYNQHASVSFKNGHRTMTHAYGSGSCEAEDGYDNVRIGQLNAPHQALWVTTQCHMPLLESAAFNAVVGLGPPGQPVYSAQEDVKQLSKSAKRFKSRGQAVPPSLDEQIRSLKAVLEAAKEKTDTLETLGVKTFSTCLGRAPGSKGFLIWNDHTREGHPGVMKLRVTGNITWSLAVENFKIGYKVMGCESGCGAIVDTGTSLIAVPSPMYQQISFAVQSLGNGDCSDLTKYPHMEFQVGSHRLRLPPSAYLGQFFGQMNKQVAGFIHTEKLGDGSARMPCQLLMMDLGPVQRTTSGPMIILGMPVFRSFYTTFDLNGGRGNRHMFFTPASSTCTPEVSDMPRADRETESLDYQMREVDLSALTVPNWILRSSGEGVREL